MKSFARLTRYYVLKFLRLKGTPWKVALGFTVGACVNFYPTFGLGTVIAGLIAGAVNINIAAAVLGDLVFKSFFPLFFYFNLLMGNYILGARANHIHRTIYLIKHLTLSNLHFIGKAFFLGALLNTLMLGISVFILVYLLLVRYRLPLARWVYKLKK
ncbi:MAG TPA: DUF2062 domain-containing protein [Desulfobacteria bacterium]|nr:DUF2062 domain-containing protein [Desulfobacteria bacterium]